MNNSFSHEPFDHKFLDQYISEFNQIQPDWSQFIKRSEEDITADHLLLDLLKCSDDRHKANAVFDKFAIQLNQYEILNSFNGKMILLLEQKFPKCSIIKSGHFYYPPGGGMQWHTNADTPYLRCYLNYSRNGDSYFKYYDQEQEKTVVSQDHTGWNLRTFEIGKQGKDLFWHSVYSNTDRVSLGFRIINNLK